MSLKGLVPSTRESFGTKNINNSSDNVSLIVLPHCQMLRGGESVMLMMVIPREPIVRGSGKTTSRV